MFSFNELAKGMSMITCEMNGRLTRESKDGGAWITTKTFKYNGHSYLLKFTDTNGKLMLSIKNASSKVNNMNN